MVSRCKIQFAGRMVNDMAGRNPKFNDSGCKDMTAYEAMKNITKEEHELNQRVHEVIKILNGLGLTLLQELK